MVGIAHPSGSQKSKVKRVKICLNQDVQDLRIFRMLLNDYLLGVGYFICLNQDVQDLRIYRMWVESIVF
jgi:hypothetical protein